MQSFFFFFLEKVLTYCVRSNYQTKIPISFWCKRGLNLKTLTQLSKILPVELWDPLMQTCVSYRNIFDRFIIFI